MQKMLAKRSLLVMLVQNYKLQPKNHRKDAWTYPVGSAYFDLIFQFKVRQTERNEITAILLKNSFFIIAKGDEQH